MSEDVVRGAVRVEQLALAWLLVPRKKVEKRRLAEMLGKFGGSADAIIERLRTRGLLTPKKLALTDKGRAEALAALGAERVTPGANWKWIQKAFMLRALGLPFTTAIHRNAGKGNLLALYVVMSHHGISISDRKPSELLQILAWKVLGETTKAKFKFEDVFTTLVGRGSTPTSEPKAPSLATLDLPGFARVVMDAARSSPTGRWHDNKVFLSHVWAELGRKGTLGAMTLDVFRARLIEAQQAKLITLSRADLVQDMQPEDVAASEIAYLNATFHLLRLDL